MKTIGIIAEFNPFHKGHLHLINACKEALCADKVVVVMSGDFVQRGYPAFCDKYTRTKMALSCGADIVFELPVCYATGSAEFFAMGAVSLLNKLGCIDQLCFGSESDDITLLSEIADILVKEPSEYKSCLNKELKNGSSFASARQKALLAYISLKGFKFPKKEVEKALSTPNNILGIEYIKALKCTNSPIQPYSIKRIGEDYDSSTFTDFSSASAIRSYIDKNGITKDLDVTMPESCVELLMNSRDRISQADKLSILMHYKLILEKDRGYDRFLDVNSDLSNKIKANLEKYTDFDSFCSLLKSKDLAYSRISRSLIHILLDITDKDMEEYKAQGYTCPLRILGMKKSASPLIRQMNENAPSKIITNLKTAKNLLPEIEYSLLEKDLRASEIYGLLCQSGPINEYRQKQLVIT